MTRRLLFKKSIVAALGLMLFSCGLYLIIQANIGVAPWDVLCFGVAWTIGVKYGTASIGISLTVVLIDVIMKEKIGLGTLIDSVVVGKTVDLLMWLDPVPMVYDNLPLSIGMLPIAFLIMGYGQYIYMKVGLCFGPRDALQVALGRRMPKVPIGVVLTILMLIVLTAGWLLGGPVGIGTVISPVGVGLMQQLAFLTVKFEPKDVVHQSLFGSWKVITTGK